MNKDQILYCEARQTNILETAVEMNMKETVPRPSLETFIMFQKFYDAGYIQALKDFGIWKDGEQTIGCLCTPVKQVVTMIKSI